MGKVFGILSLLCGIFGLFGWLIFAMLPISLPLSGFYLPGLAVIFGIVGIVTEDSKGMAIAGLILGIIGIIIVVVLPLLLVFLFFLPFL